jgi:hypothetical protein
VVDVVVVAAAAVIVIIVGVHKWRHTSKGEGIETFVMMCYDGGMGGSKYHDVTEALI